MDITLWLAFVTASAVLLTIPGPTVLLVVAHAMGGGRRSAVATVPGVALGDLTAMTVSLAGAGAVLAASATLFFWLKLAGAGYLIWLGIGLWRHAGDFAAPDRSRKAPLGVLFRQSYVVTALNPKSIVFFVAFVPQFVDPSRPPLTQFAVLIATFVTLAAINTLLWAVFGAEVGRRAGTPAVLRWAARVGGGLLIGAGALTAMVKRTV